MIKKSFALLIILTSLTSCLTTSKGEMFEFNAMVEEEDVALEALVAIPEVELFISAPFSEVSDEELLDPDDVLIPEEEIPMIKIAEQEEEEIPTMPDAPVKQYTGVIPSENIQEDVVDYARETIDSTFQEEESIEEEKKIYSPPANVPILLKEQSGIAGSEFIIDIDKEGWIYSGSDSRVIELKNREFTGDTTKFVFSISDAGSYILSFYLQNPSSGKSEEAEYNINIEAIDDIYDQAIVIEPELENQIGVENSESQEEILAAVEEENIPELVASFELLISEDDPVENTVLSDAFDLLERQGGYDRYLVDLAENAYSLYPYDNQSAELLYKAALTVEKPGPDQNIEKALSLFKLVREHFPISIYCDKSEERIRYLERHFMKIY